MLWLTGVLGLLGASAASLLTFPADQPDEDEAYVPDDRPTDQPDLLLPDASPEETAFPDISFADAVAAALSEQQNESAAHPVNGLAVDEIVFGPVAPLDLSPFQVAETQRLEEMEMNDLYLRETGGADHAAPALSPSDPEQDAFQPTTYPLAYGEPEVDNVANSSSAQLQKWISQGSPGEVVDYTASQDQLMLVWDDLSGSSADPVVEVSDDPFDPEIKHITMNGRHMAEVYGDPELTAADVAVIPLSSALIAGFEPT